VVGHEGDHENDTNEMVAFVADHNLPSKCCSREVFVMSACLRNARGCIREHAHRSAMMLAVAGSPIP
jgi:hypothetical protein